MEAGPRVRVRSPGAGDNGRGGGGYLRYLILVRGNDDLWHDFVLSVVDASAVLRVRRPTV